MNTINISGGVKPAVQPMTAPSPAEGAKPGAAGAFSFGRSVTLSQARPLSGVPTEAITDAVEKALTRDDTVGKLFSRAFKIA